MQRPVIRKGRNKAGTLKWRYKIDHSLFVCVCTSYIARVSRHPSNHCTHCPAAAVARCGHVSTVRRATSCFFKNVLKICVFGIHQLIKSFFFSFLPPSLFILKLTNLPSFTQDVSHEFFMTRRAAHKNVVVALEQ